MNIQRLAAIHLSIFLFGLSAPPTFASIVLYDGANQEIRPFLTCASGKGATYEAACDYLDPKSMITIDETDPNEKSITYIASILEPNLLVNHQVELAAKYETNRTTTLLSGDSSILRFAGNSLEGKWLISNYDVERWLTLESDGLNDGLYHVYDVTKFEAGYYLADPTMAVSNIALWGFAPVTAVPVPAAVWLFGSAIAGLAILRRRRLSLS